MSEKTQNYMTVREVAGELRCSPITVYRMVAAGSLPAIRLGRDLRISREALALLAVTTPTEDKTWHSPQKES